MDIVDKDAPLPIYVQVRQRVREAILSGKFRDRLPSERTLAQQYGIAHMTVRRALSDLVDEGILDRRVGSGTFVRKPGSAPRRAYQIGFALDPVVSGGSGNPYFARVLRGVEQAAREHGYSVVFSASAENLLDSMNAAGGSPSQRRVDGVVAVAPGDEEAARRCARLVPTVVLDNRFAGLPCVIADNVDGARQATAHLVSLGHRRIAHLAGEQGSAVGRERLEGYRLALEERALPWSDARVAFAGFNVDGGYGSVASLMEGDGPPTAIFCANDAMALGAMKRLREMGLRVPDDVSLVGFDDIETAALVDPPLSTVHVPQEEIGALAVEMLLEAVFRGEAPSGTRLVDVELVVRESSQPLESGGSS